MNTNLEFNLEFNPKFNSDLDKNYLSFYNTIKENECCICLDYMENDISILSCLHKFHNECIINWFSKKNKSICPICNNIVYISNTLKKKIEKKKAATRQLPCSHPLYRISSPTNNIINNSRPIRSNWLCCTIL